MADSATTIARLRNQEEGGNDGLWGQYTDINLTLLEDLAAGVLSKDISGEGNITLTSTNFVADEARHAVLELTGTLTNIRYVVVPNSQKTYFINNKTGNEFKDYVKTSSGSAVEIAFGKDIVYCDGNNVITTLLGASLADTITQVNNGTLAQVASSLAAIEGVNTNKDNITTVSSINGAISQVASNASNITAAANNKTNIDLAVAEPLATNISSVADNSSNINLVAGAKTNVDLVAGQISPTNNISTVAGVSSAVSSVASKVTDVTSFNLVYHGAASSDPSTRSGGSSLVAGDLYFNSSDNVLKVYSGSAWQAAALDSSSFATADLQLSNSTQHNILVADGTNFESVSVGSLSEISTVASDDLFLAIDTSGGGLKKIQRSALVAGLATSSAISNVVEDTSPELGADLDTNSFNIKFDDAHGINDDSGNELIIFQKTASAVNQIDVTNAATGNPPEISATGGDTNIGLKLTPKGSGQVVLDGNVGIESGLIDLKNGGSVSAVRFYCESSNAHYAAVVAPAHSDFSGNVTLTLPVTSSTLVGDSVAQTLSNKTLTEPKFADAGFIADANGNEQVVFQTTSSAVNALEVTNSATGNGITIGAFGSDSNVDINLTPKGTGVVAIGSENLSYAGTAILSTGAELNLVDGSSAGTIVNSKAVIYGSSGEVNATTLQIAGTSITASAAEINKLASLSTTAAELGHVNGVTSAIQTQLNTKASTGKAIAMAMVFG